MRGQFNLKLRLRKASGEQLASALEPKPLGARRSRGPAEESGPPGDTASRPVSAVAITGTRGRVRTNHLYESGAGAKGGRQRSTASGFKSPQSTLLQDELAIVTAAIWEYSDVSGVSEQSRRFQGGREGGEKK